MRSSWTLALLGLTLTAGCGRTDPLDPRTASEPNGAVDVPDGSVPGVCRLVVSPAEVDFGEVPLGSKVSAPVDLLNEGDGDCVLARVGLSGDSDPLFALAGGALADLVLGSGEHRRVEVSFDARSREKPRVHTGTLLALRAGAFLIQPVAIPLKATIVVGCDLRVSPVPLDFGNVPLNTDATRTLSLSNDGTSPCALSRIALGPSTDRLFSLTAGQPTSLTLAPDSTASLPVSFSGRDAAEPHLRTGTLTFTRTQPSGLPPTPPEDLVVPLQAFINTECTASSRWIYTIDDQGTLAEFNPTTRQFTNIGVLRCPDAGSPFSMAVDQNAIAWVEYTTGQIYRVDTRTAACSATSFKVNPSLSNFGMGFVFDPISGKDSLYVAGGTYYGETPSTLGTIAFPSLSLTPVGKLYFGAPELTGTGDGQLWGFAPSFNSASGVTTLARIDPKTAAVLAQHPFTEVSLESSSYALSFWGGSFWLFLGSTIYEVPRSTLKASLAVPYSGHNVVGAGVSTCAPLE